MDKIKYANRTWLREQDSAGPHSFFEAHGERIPTNFTDEGNHIENYPSMDCEFTIGQCDRLLTFPLYAWTHEEAHSNIGLLRGLIEGLQGVLSFYEDNAFITIREDEEIAEQRKAKSSTT